MQRNRPFHVMIIPTLGCPSKCSYCWSSEVGSPVMSIDTIREIVEWLKVFRDDPVTFTFHGGEPLLAGVGFYREALPMLAEGLSHLTPSFALQTNLWTLTPELAEVLKRYDVPIGSSLDGPKDINDFQRSEGYYDRTMRGYSIARDHGLSVQFICTFTSHSIKYKEDIFEFFMSNGLTLKLHPALPSLRSDEPERWALDPAEYGELLVYLLDRYLENMDRIEVRNINDLCRSVFSGRGTVCTFVDCIDNTFAVGPDGGIYPCYRFVGMSDYVMGSVYDRPLMDDIRHSDAWRRMNRFRECVEVHCKKCRHVRYCKGGCPYNAISHTDGMIRGVDPYCIAYRRIFDEIADRFNKELLSSFGLQSNKPGIMALIRKIASKEEPRVL